MGDSELGSLCRQGLGPRLALSGHVHEPVGSVARIGQTLSVNPGCHSSRATPRFAEIEWADSQLGFPIIRCHL